MNILLDSHILIWALANDARLPKKAAEYILDPDNSIYYSAVSIWEMTLKHMLYPEEITFSGQELAEYCDEAGFLPLDLTAADMPFLETLSRPEGAPRHKDPFDRMLIAQAKAQEMLLLTHDALLPYYQEECILPV